MTEQKTHLSRADRIKAQLGPRFTPVALELSDDSAKHAGHAGAAPGGETHYRLRLVSPAFEGLSRVARQRLVYEALREEFESGLHALSLDLKTPAEA
ncbi:MAG TPA: BolA family protein [Terricaulis sp.]|nr:BolA family protein [Terricaulis sp.]HRP09880.1 BolA family protein [Terricaulis sp.]